MVSRRDVALRLRAKFPAALQMVEMIHPYAEALHDDPSATLDDLREAVTRFEELTRIARRVLGGSHPTFTGIERELVLARKALRARELYLYAIGATNSL